MNRGVLLPLVGSLALLLGSGLGWAGQYDEKERAELAQALKGAKVSLKRGIVASAPKGKPISGKTGSFSCPSTRRRAARSLRFLLIRRAVAWRRSRQSKAAKILRRPRHRPTQWQRPRHHFRQQSMPPSRRIQGFGPSARSPF